MQPSWIRFVKEISLQRNDCYVAKIDDDAEKMFDRLHMETKFRIFFSFTDKIPCYKAYSRKGYYVNIVTPKSRRPLACRSALNWVFDKIRTIQRRKGRGPSNADALMHYALRVTYTLNGYRFSLTSIFFCARGATEYWSTRLVGRR